MVFIPTISKIIDDENYLLLGSAQRNKEEAYFYVKK